MVKMNFSIFKNALTWLLCGQLTLSSSAPAWAEAASTEPIPAAEAAASADLAKLFFDISGALNRAQYPGDPITKAEGGPVTPAELDAYNSRLGALNNALNKFIEAHYQNIALIEIQKDGQPLKFSDENSWLAAVALYFEMAERLERARVATGEAPDPSGWVHHDLKLPLADFSLLEFLLSAAVRLEAEESQSSIAHILTRVDPTQNVLIFSLNPELAMSMFADQISSNGTVDNVKKYLS